MSKFLININGEITSEENAKISVLDRGFLYGDSVYEATRTFNKIPFRIDAHIDRLFESAEKIYFKPKYTKDNIKNEVLKLIAASEFKDVHLRIVLTRGENRDLGLDPNLSIKENLIIYLKELKPNPTWWYEKGISLCFYQKESSSRGALPKTGNYIENMLAHREATSKGFFDSIMINNDLSITECTTSNIWIVKDQIVYTPPTKDGVLPGLTRANLLALNNRQPFKIIEKSLEKEDILKADECFISSTTRFLVPVTQVEDKKIGDGFPGKVTLNLLETYKNQIQKELNH